MPYPVQCPYGCEPGDLLDETEVNLISKKRMTPKASHRRFIPRPSKFIVKIWIIFEVALFIIMLYATLADSWATIQFSSECSSLEDIHVDSFTFGLYAGFGTDDGCRDKSDSNICIAFDDRNMWKYLDKILNTKMEYEVSVVMAIVQTLMPLGLLFSFLAIMTHGLIVITNFMSDTLARYLTMIGMGHLVIAGVSVIISYSMLANADIVAAATWQRYIQLGYSFRSLESFKQLQDSNPIVSSTAFQCVVTKPDSEEEGSTVAFACFVFSIVCVFLVLVNGCCGAVCCAPCVEDEDGNDFGIADFHADDIRRQLSGEFDGNISKTPRGRRRDLQLQRQRERDEARERIMLKQQEGLTDYEFIETVDKEIGGHWQAGYFNEEGVWISDSIEDEDDNGSLLEHGRGDVEEHDSLDGDGSDSLGRSRSHCEGEGINGLGTDRSGSSRRARQSVPSKEGREGTRSLATLHEDPAAILQAVNSHWDSAPPHPHHVRAR